MLAAIELFGARGFDAVGVGELARVASTTTGPLYHHFGTKLGLYQLVRRDVEQRVADRMQGALEAGAPLSRALVVGFDYAHRTDNLRMIGEPHPDPSVDSPIDELLDAQLGRPLAAILASAWRRALVEAAAGAADDEVREAIERITPDGSLE